MELISKAKDERAKYNIRVALASKEPARDYVAAIEIRRRLRDPDHTVTAGECHSGRGPGVPIADCLLRISDRPI